MAHVIVFFFFFSSRRRHTRLQGDWSSDVCSSDLLYRLAILDSWDGKLVRSLARFIRLRRIDPRDPDIMVSHAQGLAWAGQTAASEALYDSVLLRFPGRADALAGRARAIALGRGPD